MLIVYLSIDASVKMLPQITMMSLCPGMHGINAANGDGEMTEEEPE